MKEQVKVHSPFHTRFSATSWYKNRPDVTLVGAGNVGSWLSMVLLKCGYHINLYEFDGLEDVNIGPQLYPKFDKATTKVAALQRLAESFSDREVRDLGKFEHDSMVTPVMIVTADNMEVRKLIFEKWRKQDNRLVLIDGRTFRDSLQVFAVTRKNEDVYQKEHLFDDSEVEEANCADKSFPYVGAIIGGLLASVLTNVYSNINAQKKIKRVPFFQSFDITLMRHERNNP